MKLTINQQAPDFSTTDVAGTSIQLKKFKGQKVYLAFERNAGCPVCNLRTHELLKQANSFSKKNIAVLMVYESTPEKMKEYLGDEKYPFHFIPDPTNSLYRKYYVEQSMGKLMKSLFNGLLPKVMQGKKLFKKSISQDGHTTTIPSEFMIDENGNLSKVHYGKFVGDHLPIQELN
ncbi:MAG TPA: peroxiredoxin-like family protein [Chryseolinea sp.]|nr:peroxiredoxin-like family protein [Chryseolinea sp.]HPM28959.1 peroxiredoxin-like family protein [Chryseolinea sp.]